MKKFDGIAKAVSAVLIAGACLGAGSWLGDRDDDSLLALRGGDPKKKAVKSSDCGDLNTTAGQVGWLSCTVAGTECVRCDGSFARTFVTKDDPLLGTPSVNFTVMQACSGDRIVSVCANDPIIGALVCLIDEMPMIVGTCNQGTIHVGVYQDTLPPGSGD